jgi:hypothetical protein
MVCIRFVKTMGHPDDPCVSQAFYLLLCKMRTLRNVGMKQVVNFLLDKPWFAVSFAKDQHCESVHFAISYNLGYVFV